MVDITANPVEDRTLTSGAEMDPIIGGALIGGAANLIGGGLSFLGGSNANAANSALGYAQLQSQQHQFDQQMAFAREQFNTGGFVDIQNRVNAAKAFGISPLVAMGTPSYSPPGIPVGTVSGGGGNEVNAFGGLAESMGRMGSDISRAAMATKTQAEKDQIALQNINLARQGSRTDAEINMLNAQANYYNARAAGTPAFPSVGGVSDTGQVIGGQGNSSGLNNTGRMAGGVLGGYINKLPELTTSSVINPGVVGGRASPADQAYRTSGGSIEFQPAQGSPASQGDMVNSILNGIRNRLMPPDMGSPYIMEQIRKNYPGAVGYRAAGPGYYAPVYPEEQVRDDVRMERFMRYLKPWEKR